MTALVWKQAAKVWWSAFRDCQALLAMCRAELDAADRRVSEALDERDVAVAAHHELAADYDELRGRLTVARDVRLLLAKDYNGLCDQVRALQSELAQRANNDALRGLPPRECSEAEFWLFVGELHRRWFDGRAA